jgi:hypothetical protein
MIDEATASGAPGSCRQVSNRDACWAGVGLQTAWRTREECCVRNFDFFSEGCALSCWLDPKAVEGAALRGAPPGACVEVRGGGWRGGAGRGARGGSYLKQG